MPPGLPRVLTDTAGIAAALQADVLTVLAVLGDPPLQRRLDTLLDELADALGDLGSLAGDLAAAVPAGTTSGRPAETLADHEAFR